MAAETHAQATAVMLPVLDLLNHHHSARMTWLRERDRLTFQTDKALLSGEQIFNTYGPKGNEELLLGYGFIVDDNPADSVAVAVTLPSDGSTRGEIVRKVLSSCGLLRPRYMIRSSEGKGIGSVPEDVLAVIAISTAPIGLLDDLHARSISRSMSVLGYLEADLTSPDPDLGRCESKLGDRMYPETSPGAGAGASASASASPSPAESISSSIKASNVLLRQKALEDAREHLFPGAPRAAAALNRSAMYHRVASLGILIRMLRSKYARVLAAGEHAETRLR